MALSELINFHVDSIYCRSYSILTLCYYLNAHGNKQANNEKYELNS